MSDERTQDRVGRRFAGRVVIVTGASREPSIGRATRHATPTVPARTPRSRIRDTRSVASPNAPGTPHTRFR